MHSSITPTLLSGLHEDPEIVHVVFRTVPVWHECAQAAVAIDQVSIRRVGYGIARGHILSVGKNAVGISNRFELLGGPGATEEGRIKACKIATHPLRVVPLWVHRQVEHLHILALRAEH